MEQGSSGGINKRLSSEVGVNALGAPPSKSFVFDVASASKLRESTGLGLLGFASTEQRFPGSFQLGGTECGTSKLESFARRLADEPIGTRVCMGGRIGVPSFSGVETQLGLGVGWRKYYPSDSARTFLEDSVERDPLTNIDPHQQVIGLNANQMIQFARAVGLEVSLANFGMLEDLLMRTCSMNGWAASMWDWGHYIVSSSLRLDRLLPRALLLISFYSLPTILESVASNPLPDSHHQQPRSGGQADDTSGFPQTQVTDVAGSESLNALCKFVRISVIKGFRTYSSGQERVR